MSGRLVWRPSAGLRVFLGSQELTKSEDFVSSVEARFRSKLATAFLSAIEAVQRDIKRTSTDSFHVEPLLEAALRGAGLPGTARSFQEVLTEAIQWSGQQAVSTLHQRAQKRSIAEMMTFDLLSPQMVDFIRGYLFNLITNITQDVKEMIRGVVYRGFVEGHAPREQAREIRDSIGLTAQQSQAAANYRRMLESGDYRAALDRQLRDARFDPSVRRAAEGGATLTREQVDRMVTRYRERSLKYRAEMIARTETIRAAASGLQEAWRQAQEQGLVNATARQRWLIASDERTCPQCKAIVRMNQGGVLLGSKFQTPFGAISGPPAHPMCRCSMGLIP